jgi:phage FluMu protein gp41
MKKIVKLTENDLTRIVKRVIKENDNKMSHDPSYKNPLF